MEVRDGGGDRLTAMPAARALTMQLRKEVMTVRKLALLGAIAALWLFVAAIPAFADGGPHVMATNNGTAGLTADSCAGCHRAHTATAASLLNTEQPDLCLNCHDGSKATTDVIDGVQYSSTGGNAPVLNALRGGGFQYALIDSSNAARLSYTSGTATRNIGHVQPLATGQAVTSTHGGTGGIYSAGWGTGTVWGNGAVNSGTGATVTLECASCHNPHGNGQYRILQTAPSLTATTGTYTVSIAAGVQVKDTTTTGTHNYTISPATDGADAGGSAANVLIPSSGDYWRYHWDPTGVLAWTNTGTTANGGTAGTAPGADQMNTGWNGVTAVNAAANGGVAPANKTGLMTAWCIQCHTRYNGYSTTVTNGVSNYTPGGNQASSLVANSADLTFMYKHGTTRIGCEQCHVSHGSNAAMTGTNSVSYKDPNGQIPPRVGNSGDSRLLKVDNRGTCQMCHDPTGTVTAGTFVGPDGSGGVYSGPFTSAPVVPGN
jgi:predicted CXXCH cytochrome family protein